MKPGHRDVKLYYVNSFINMVKGVLPVSWRLWKRPPAITDWHGACQLNLQGTQIIGCAWRGRVVFSIVVIGRWCAIRICGSRAVASAG